MSNDPYKAPESSSENTPAVHGQPLSRDQLGLVAWLCVCLAVFDAVLGVMSINKEWQTVSHFIGIIYSLASAYVLLAWNRLLNQVLGICGTAKIILPMIVFGFVYAVLPFISSPELTLESGSLSLTDSIFIVSLIPYGVLTILLGRKLQESNIAYPHLSTLSWLHITAGFCMASLVLLIVAVPLSIAINLFMAQLFFYARKNSISPAD